MNKIEKLLNQLDEESRIYDISYGFPLADKNFRGFATYTIKYFCKELIDEARHLVSDDSASKFLDEYLKIVEEPLQEEMVKVTYSTLKNFSWQKVMGITNIDILNNQVYTDEQLFEITKDQFNLLFK